MVQMVKVSPSRIPNLLRLRTCNASIVLSQVISRFPSPWSGKVSLLERYASDVSYQTRHTVWLDLGAKRWHFSSALGDYFTKHRVRLLLNFGGSQILGFHGLAGWRTTAAVVRMTQRAVRLEDFRGIGLGLRADRGQAT